MSAVGDMVGSIFGGSSSGAGAQQSSSSQSSDSRLDPEIKKLFMENFARASGVANNLGVQQFAPRTADYNVGQGLVRSTASPTSAGMNSINTAANLTGTNANATSYGNVADYLNPYTDYVAGNTLDMLGRANAMALDKTRGEAIANKAFGGSRSGIAEAETNRNFFNTAGNTLGNLYNTAYTNAMGQSSADLTRQLNAANQLGALGTTQQEQGYKAGANTMNLGLMDQDYQQKILDATRNLPIEQQAIVNQALGINPAGGAGNVSTGAGSSNASTMGQGILGSLGSAAQGIGSAIGPAALAYLAFSDENLKENIEDIKDPLDKLKFLRGTSYNYKGKDYKSAGIIAQDVEKVMPRAVFDTPDGKAVDYTAVTGLLVSAVNDLAAKVEKKGAKHGRAI